MKKEQRNVYLELAKEVNASLCTFCKYAEWIADGCCDGYAECHHPIDNLSYTNTYEEDCLSGDDCYGFTPSLSVRLVADLVGAILSAGYEEWFYRKFSPKSVTVYGRHMEQGKEISGKIKINPLLPITEGER